MQQLPNPNATWQVNSKAFVAGVIAVKYTVLHIGIIPEGATSLPFQI